MAPLATLVRPLDADADADAGGGSPDEPETPTGHYPEPVWAEPGSTTQGLEVDEDDPPSATGHYPEPVWAEPTTDDGGVSATQLDVVGSAVAALPGESVSLKDDDRAPDPATRVEMPAPSPMTNEAIYRIVRVVADGHSGADGYSAIRQNLEVATAGHPAFGGRQYGLELGLLLADQESGLLGQVLQRTASRNPAALREILGEATDDVLAVTTAGTVAERLAPVTGEPLWAPVWVDRFRALGALPECQAAQNEVAIEVQFRPMALAVAGLGLDTDRALAMAFDVVVSRGLDAGLRWIADVVAPLDDAGATSAAAVLGHSDLGSFERAVGLPPSPAGGPAVATRVGLTGALRRRIPSFGPTAVDLEYRMIRAAGGPARARLERLFTTPALTDGVLLDAPSPPAGA